MHDASLTVSLTDLPDERLAQLTRELARDLSRNGIRAETGESPPVPGDKGDPITIGVLLLALVTSGTIKAAIDCFKTYLSREPSLTITLKGQSGTQVVVTARNVDTSAVRDVLEAVASARSG